MDTNRKLGDHQRHDDRWQQLLETAPDAIVVVQETGLISFANQQTETLFGYANDELLDQPIEILLPERFRKNHRKHLQRYSKSPDLRPMGAGLELYGRRKDGSEFPVEISLSPLRVEGELLVSSAIRDVTARRELEAKLQRALQDAESAVASKSRFIAAASHDLRQPLQAASLYLELATSGQLERAELDETLHKITRCVDALRSLLDKVLHISKLDAGNVATDKRPVRLDELFEQLKEQFRPQAESQGLELRVVRSKMRVHSDPVLLRQMLENLLSNALRYTEKGRVLLGCRRWSSDLRIQVWDTGIGIPEEHLELVFRDFHQLRKAGHDAQVGLGLGLSIVRRLAELLGHSVRVKSISGEGSMFEVVAQLDTSRTSAPEVELYPDLATGTVALLDDEPAVLDALETVLQLAGYRVVASTTIDDLLEQLSLEDRPPGALVTDYRLGEAVTGLKALDALRQQYGPGLGAVVLTGDSSFQSLMEQSKNGGFSVLAKPVDSKTLNRELRRCLSAAASRSEV